MVQNLINALFEEFGIQLVWCPPGTFYMGSLEIGEFVKPIEIPVHQVRISKGFWIGESPVTIGQWELVTKKQYLNTPGRGSNPQLPVESLSWHESKDFCERINNWLKLRNNDLDSFYINLPTEVQWEYSCRANSSTYWCFGNEIHLLGDYCWHEANSNYKINPVKLKKPNDWGIYDMHGNVAEWCLDDFAMYKDFDGFSADPVFIDETSDLKIVRGGAFSYPALETRAASREAVLADNSYKEPIGFRIVLNIEYP